MNETMVKNHLVEAVKGVIAENELLIESYKEKIASMEEFIKSHGMEKEFQQYLSASKEKGMHHGRKR